MNLSFYHQNKILYISFLPIGNAYFSFVLLFSTSYNLFQKATYNFMHEFCKTKPINRTSSSRILLGFPRHLADIFNWFYEKVQNVLFLTVEFPLMVNFSQ